MSFAEPRFVKDDEKFEVVSFSDEYHTKHHKILDLNTVTNDEAQKIGKLDELAKRANQILSGKTFAELVYDE